MVNVNEWIPEFEQLKGARRDRMMEAKISSVRAKGSRSLKELVRILSRVGSSLLVVERILKREEMLLFLDVKGELDGKPFEVNFDPDKDFVDVYFYGQDEGKLIPCFVEWTGYDPHHRYRSRDISPGPHRIYAFDKDVNRADYLLKESTMKRTDVYDVERC